MAKRFRKGSAIKVIGIPWRGPDRGTVTQITPKRVRVLFPIRKFVWLLKCDVEIVGFDGDGSSVHWR